MHRDRLTGYGYRRTGIYECGFLPLRLQAQLLIAPDQSRSRAVDASKQFICFMLLANNQLIAALCMRGTKGFERKEESACNLAMIRRKLHTWNNFDHFQYAIIPIEIRQVELK